MSKSDSLANYQYLSGFRLVAQYCFKYGLNLDIDFWVSSRLFYL